MPVASLFQLPVGHRGDLVVPIASTLTPLLLGVRDEVPLADITQKPWSHDLGTMVNRRRRSSSGAPDEGHLLSSWISLLGTEKLHDARRLHDPGLLSRSRAADRSHLRLYLDSSAFNRYSSVEPADATKES